MAPSVKRRRKMLISVLPGEQVEVVLTEDGKVQEYYVEMLHQHRTKGNIYRGVIHNIDTSLQAAFINYGAHKNGFLQIDEIHPEYYGQPHDPHKGHKYPLIQKVLKAGQDILVQVVKEPVGSKGAFLTTFLSLPGRYVVLTPGREQVGVSRKVEDEAERARLKEIIEGVKLEEGLGAIVRTASMGANKTNIAKDLQFLKRLWKEVRKKGQEATAPELVYQEPSLAARSIRDYLTEDVAEVWVDDRETFDEVDKFASLIFPRRAKMVKHHDATERTLWERFSVGKQLEQIYAREVNLPSGGRLVFDQTEALMAVDINSGKIGGKASFQEMAFRTNLEAAETIPEQLRLRDVGGQVVIDFIEIKDRKQCAEVEKALRNAMKVDRARHDVGRLSKFGLLQVVRQRIGSSALSVSTEPCPCCNGAGSRRNMEWQSMQALKTIYQMLRAQAPREAGLVFKTKPELALYLLNNKKEKLLQLEEDFQTTVTVSIE